MTDHPLPDSLLGLLAEHLAKLNHQLRQVPADPSPDKSWAEPGLVGAVVNRLQVAAALLSDAKFGADSGLAPLARLGSALGELAPTLHDASVRLPVDLLPPLRQLADFLAGGFTRLDEGEDPVALGRDPRWEAILAAFFNAGTELQTLDELEEQMRRWQRHYATQTLSAAQEDALRCRWDQLRELGDSLYGAAPVPALNRVGEPQADLAGCDVMLLVSSPFRQDQLRERLMAAGCEVEIAADPQSAMTRMGAVRSPDMLLCDNLEPSRNLTAVRQRLTALTPSERPGLILVAAAGGNPQRLQQRARRLGAQGAWADPFRPADLVSILD